MPNTQPPATDAAGLQAVLALAAAKACCDYAQYLGAGTENAAELLPWLPSGRFKMYLDQTFGPLRLDEMTVWQEHFKRWPPPFPWLYTLRDAPWQRLCCGAPFTSGRCTAVTCLPAKDILTSGGQRGRPGVTCEVTPHSPVP